MINGNALGIASEELDPGDWSSLRLSLVQFSGPTGGQFSLWQADLFGNPDVKMTTSDGLGAGDSMLLTPGAHDHFNYGFTQPGVYDLTFQWKGVHKSEGAVAANGTYSFGVTAVPEPGTNALLALGLVGLACWKRRR
jgi:surface-anchored protein